MSITQEKEMDHPFDPRREASLAGICTKELERGKGYYNTVFKENNCELAFESLRRSAQLGNAEAQYRLGDLYALGQGTKKSDTDAYKWYTKAALQGYKKALIRIHNLYSGDVMMHRGGRSNDDDDDVSNGAINYYTTQFRKYKQSNSKDGNIQENLAFQYQHGYGVKKYIQWAIELYSSAAQQGYIEAQFNLGQLYENNSDIKFNFKKAVKWYTMAAKQGNDLAQNKLGQLYEKGLGTDMDYTNALYWYTKAANQGNRDAQYSLGRLYRKGGGSTNQCYASAIKWYSLAAQQGSSVAQNCLELLKQKGISVQETSHLSRKKTLCSKLRSDISILKDPLLAEEQKKLASRALVGDGEAMYQIGYNYYHGIHFDQEKHVGFQWCIRAAKTKNEKARMLVANLYKEGNIVDQNYFKASIWYTKSAKQNDRDAQYDLGLLYKKGHGVRKDPLEASKWFIKSADQGHVIAPYQLGVLKYEENGLDYKNQDAKEAFAVSAHRGHIDAYYKLGFLIMHCNGEPATFLHLFKHAARLGSTRAQYLLGVLYERGQYVEHNLIKAKMYYTMAAKSTHPKFQFKMALKYLKGRVVDQNYSMAFDLFRRAAKNGLVDAKYLFSMPIIPTTKPASFYALIVTMLETVSNQHDLESNIGYIYEFGITNALQCLFEKNWQKAIAWYNEGIIKGDPHALFRLGVMYEEGKGTEKDLKNTLYCYTRAHHQGVMDATYRLACIYLGGYGVPQDYIKAFHLYTMASHNGHEKSRMLLSTDDTCKSADEPLHHNILSMLKAVANTGSVALQYRLGIFYEESDMAEAMEWYMLAARAGMLEACYKLGHIYEQEQKYRQAVDLFEKAAKGNHDDALYELGKMYLDGRGVERDYLKAYELYKIAAQQGNDLAYDMLDPVIYNEKTNSILMYKLIAQNGNRDLQYKLGVYYDKELGFSEAIKWYSMAAADLHREALYRLGILYEKGLGMEPNYQKSLQLYNQAADRGHSDAIYKLAIIYYNGNGVDKDSSLAVKYCQKAAEKNNSTCQYILGTFYEHGHVVPKDILKALEWYSKSYIQGNDHSASKLYNMYIDVKYESEFYLKLFRILSVFEKSEETSDSRLYSEYGYMYYSLGTLYYYGRGPKKDVYAALKYFSIACHKYGFGENMITLDYNRNDPEGQDNLLGKLNIFYKLEYQHKTGMYNHELSTQNLAEAKKDHSDQVTTIRIAKNYLKAFISAENKRPESLINIANMYLNGQGVTQNDTFALLLYKFVAEQLEDYVNFEFGIKFYRGEGANQNYQVSIVFLKKSAEQNYTRAQRYLGDMYYYGDGVDINYDEALKWYKRSINETLDIEQDTVDDMPTELSEFSPSKHSIATKYYEKGMKYYNGDGTNKDYKISAIYLRKAAERGYRDAQTCLAMIYLQGHGVKSDMKEAMRWFKASTEEMNPEEAYEQGTKFYKDTDIKHNYEIPFLYHLKAAEMGHPQSQFSVGCSYFQGFGVEKEEDKALEWFKRYAIVLNGLECYDLGMNFYVGDRFGKSLRVAIFFFKRASEQGNANAQAQLGDIYLRGLGTEPNYDEALKLYQWSSSEKSGRYCFERSEKFYIGNGVKHSYEISFLYMKKAAEKGYHEAKFKVGEMYIQGIGTEKNNTEANKWLAQYIEKMDASSCYEKGLLYSEDGANRSFDISSIYLKAAAEKRHTKAYAKLGDMYLQGHGVEQSYTEALKYYELYTEKMDQEDLYEFGDGYYHADGEIFNQKVALVYFQKASEKNHGMSQARLAEMYLLGVEVEQNRERAFELIHLSTKNMDKYDLYMIGERYYYGTGVDINYEIAAIYFKTSADQGNDQAEAKLGDMYYYGLGVEKNHDKAMEWHTRSLEGITPADCYSLSKRYTDDGDTQCYQIAYVYIKLAAEGRYPAAQNELGDMYLNGKGVEQDNEKALEWYTNAAKANPSMYTLMLAEIYHCTTMGLHDFAKALHWYQKVRGSNKSFALRGIGLLYEYGDGVEQDEEKAVAFYKDAVNTRNNGACYNLGLMYYYGKGVEQNYNKAFEWFTQTVKREPSSDSTHIFVQDSVNNRKKHEYVLAKEDLGYRKAHYFLGIMYENGYGIPEDSDQAKKHLDIFNEYCAE